MKAEVLSGLLTARTLFDIARTQCFVRDRHVASAGLIVLQDALEIVFYSCLVEIGADEDKPLESLTFDQLIGELKARSFAPIKSGTLKAMNKQRVLVKHYSQLAEPAAVQNYFSIAQSCADALLVQVVGKPLLHIVIADAIQDEKQREQVHAASNAIDASQFFEGMVAARKALFLAIESEYDIREWATYDPSESWIEPPSLLFAKHGAPSSKRNKAWIEACVCEPTDYIQLDHGRARIDMMELGIDPEEFFNVLRLTPNVYHLANEQWAIKSDRDHEAAASEDNARYCLDVVVSILMKQQSRRDMVRVRSDHDSGRLIAILTRDQPLLEKASFGAAPGRTLPTGTECRVNSIVFALDGDEQFVEVSPMAFDDFFTGYLPVSACNIEGR